MKALRTTDQLGGPAWAAISPGRSTRARRRESKSTKEAAAAIVSLSQQAGRQNKSLGKGTSAQLDGCAFISGLLASDRDDIKAGRDGTGRGAAEATGAPLTANLLLWPLVESFPVMQAFLRLVLARTGKTQDTGRKKHSVAAKLQHP